MRSRLPDVAGVLVVPALASGTKCARCWQVLDEVGKSAKHPLICLRCEGGGGIMRTLDKQAMGHRPGDRAGRPARAKKLLMRYLLKAGGMVVQVIRRFLPPGDRLQSRVSASASWGATRRCRPGSCRWLQWRCASAFSMWLRRIDRPLIGWGIGLVIGWRHRQCYRPCPLGRGVRFRRFSCWTMALAGIQRRRFGDRGGRRV